MKQIFLCLSFLFFLGNGWCEVFKYRDENGVLRFTDDPAELPPKDVKVMSGTASARSGGDLEARLIKNLKPVTAIEKAVLCTVLVKSTAGQGTGFFYTHAGHIITNRHVIRGDARHFNATKKQYDADAEQIKSYQHKLKQEGQRIQTSRRELEIYQHTPIYQQRLQTLRQWEKEHEHRQRKYKQAKKSIEQNRRTFNLTQSQIGLARTFQIELADHTELSVYLVAVSEKYDLALLRLQGFTKTPALKDGSSKTMHYGAEVYAVGNPIRQRNTVTSGIMSGFADQFIKTNAHIYPGNSGGPLVNKAGQVIGVNTFKKITHKFEGLGYALSIETVKQEFSRYF